MGRMNKKRIKQNNLVLNKTLSHLDKMDLFNRLSDRFPNVDQDGLFEMIIHGYLISESTKPIAEVPVTALSLEAN